ncbi:type II secretion system protein GspL [Chitinibacter sp. SCUT-21]|uniref:type II secretion system protein GspL n=1 Tax=Chitinibacter sp. SCUT-21 TaxID=2970891 RepID=UPI0035A65539
MAQNVSRVVLRLSHEPIKVYDWFAFDAEGEQIAHQLTSNQHWPSAAQLDLAIPAQWLTAHRLALPKVNEKQRQQLITQALEDRVLGRLDDYQWQAGPVENGHCTVWLLEISKLAQLKTWANEQGLHFTRWITEFALLGEQNDCMLAASSGLMARLGGECVWLADESELLALRGERVLQALNFNQVVAPSKTAVSFYHGKTPAVSLHMSWQDWRWAVYLLGVCIALVLLSMMLQWRTLAQRESALRQEIRQTFASLYPGMPIVDPMLQWQSLQKKGEVRGGDALDLLYRSAAQMAGDYNAHSISVKNGKVSLIVPAAQGAALLSQLQAQGAQVQSTNLPDGRLNVELQP